MKKSKCLDCKIDVYKTDGVYMLKDNIWNKVHNSSKGFLCIKCLEKRLKRKLTPIDFNNSYVNNKNYGTKSILLSNRLGLI